MRSRRLVTAVVLGGSLLAGAAAAAAEPPAAVPPAAEVLDAAAKAGRAGKKNVLVLFHASWCSWCRRLEAVLATPGAREVLDRHFETATLTVLERGEKEKLENPGAEELLSSLAGNDAGLPFAAVFERKTRRALASSNTDGPGTNVGFPAKAEEIDHFVGMLRTGAPRMTAAEAEAIRAAFPAPR